MPAAASVALLAMLVGCGDAGRPENGSRAQETTAPAKFSSPASTPGRTGGTRGLPSASEVRAGQKKVIDRSRPSAQVEEARAFQTTPEEPSKATAPRDVLELATKAAREWLAFRVSGDAPDEGVIPRVVWDGVAPMVPTEQVKGAARLSGITAFSAHPEDEGWSVSVSTEDPRAQTLVVLIGKDKTVTGVNG